jgi:NADH:ubiquinone oxidoreductase subunit 2 (subunit N)
LTIDDLNGVARRYPLAALTLTIALLGLAGIPPLAGFASKWQIFVAGVETRDAVVVAFIAFAAFNSLLSLGYYLPLMRALYQHEASDAVQTGRGMPFTMRAPLVMLAFGVVAIGVWPDMLQWLTGAAAKAVLAAFGG